MCLIGCSFGMFFVHLDSKFEQHKLASATNGGEKPLIKKVNLRNVGELPVRLWLIGLIISTYYICIFAFVVIAKSFFQAKWHGDDAIAGPAFWQANLRASTVYFMSMMLSIFVGAFVDKIGHRAHLSVLTCALSIPCFLIFRFTYVDPIWGMLLLGVTYMFAASTLWPGIPLVVPKHLIGTANGMATSTQMVGIALANMAVGSLQDSNPEIYPGTNVHSYAYCLDFFMAMGVVATCLSLVLNVVDAKSGGQLNATPAQRSREEALQQSLLRMKTGGLPFSPKCTAG